MPSVRPVLPPDWKKTARLVPGVLHVPRYSKPVTPSASRFIKEAGFGRSVGARSYFFVCLFEQDFCSMAIELQLRVLATHGI